ncbi:MAG: restriction endonuclease [Thomasclavelia sp.]|nr:restriction endonuclease [Thomasclavelia sp.]
MKMIDNMSGKEFEEFILEVYKKLGYKKVSLSKENGDFGIDIFCKKDDISYGIQCKRYKRKVGVEAIQQVASGKDYYNLDEGVVITNSYFSSAASTLAANTNITLINRDDLIKILKRNKLFKSKIPFYYHLVCLMIIILASYLQVTYNQGLIIGLIAIFIETIMIIRSIIIIKSYNVLDDYNIHQY